MRSHCLCYICIFHTSKGAVLFFVEKHGVGRGDTNNVEWKAGAEELAVVKVIDFNGKILINKQFSGLIKNTNNLRRLDLAGIRSGAYVLQVISGSVSTTKRFTIL
jgi:hypothetical protein